MIKFCLEENYLYLEHKHADHETLKLAKDMPKIDYPKPDNVIIFDKTSSVYLTGTNHADNQPVHLVKNPDLTKYTLDKYDEPAQRYCPVEFMKFKLRITFQNLL